MATLHPTRRIQALLPLYVQRFSCVGPECVDSCCAGWTVTIDKKTFNAYRKTSNPALADRLETHLKRVRSQASDGNYAHMELVPSTGECPMVEDKLCSVQKELGEDKLSNTCFTYPRANHEAGGVYHQSLTLSCPEAARLALLADDAFDFVEHDIHVRPDTLQHLTSQAGLSLAQMNEVRFFCIQIVKIEGLQVWQKLAIVGLLCESLADALKNGTSRRVSDILRDTQELITSGQTAAMFDSMQPQYGIQAVTFTLLWQAKSQYIRPQHRAVYKAMAEGLGADESGRVSEEQLVARYAQGVARLSLALQGAPALLENYVLNEMLRESFPFGRGGGNPLEQYLRLVTRFGLVRFMLAVQCSEDRPLPTPEWLAHTVQVFARRFQHDKAFATQVDNSFKNSGWDQLDKVLRFLKA